LKAKEKPPLYEVDKNLEPDVWIEADIVVEIRADEGNLMLLPSGADLGEVVKALTAIGATTQDLVSILQALKAAGALRAELEII